MKFPGTALDHVIRKLNGAPFKYMVEPESPTEEPRFENVTIRYALCYALTYQRPVKEGERAATGVEKLELYTQAARIQSHPKEKNIEFKAAEITTLQKKCDAAWGVEMYGFLHAFLEGDLDFPPFPETAKAETEKSPA